jgi:hypothetical protein
MVLARSRRTRRAVSHRQADCVEPCVEEPRKTCDSDIVAVHSDMMVAVGAAMRRPFATMQ